LKVYLLLNEHYWKKGVLPICISASLWGLGYFSIKFILVSASPFQLTFLSSLIASFYLLIVHKLKWTTLVGLFKKNPVIYTVHALTGVPIATTLMLFGLARVDLGVATLLQNLYMVFTPVIARIFLGERMSPRWLPYALLAFVSAYLLSTKDPLSFGDAGTDWIGIAAIIGAALGWSIAAASGKALVNINASPAEITFLRFGLGGLLMLPGFFFPSFLDLSIEFSPLVLGVLAFNGIFAIAIGYLLLYRGLEHVPISTCVFLELTSPLVATTLGVVFLAESFSISQIVGIFLLLFAVLQLTRQSVKP
jgi:drug/metabolite transporter (DMT)-like permease